MPQTFTWTVQPASVSLPSPGGLSSGSAEPRPRRVRRGLLRPFRRDGAGGLAMGTGDDLDASQLGQLIGSDRGPIWDGERHAGLDNIRNERNTQVLADLAEALVQEAIARFLPHLIAISVIAIRETNQITLTIKAVRREELGTTSPRVFTASSALPIKQGSS